MVDHHNTIVRKTNGEEYIGTAGIDSLIPVSVTAMPIWQLLLIRVVRMYIQTILGLLSLSGLGMIMMEGVLKDWSLIAGAMLAALAPTFVSFLQNLLEFLTKIDVKNPQWRA